MRFISSSHRALGFVVALIALADGVAEPCTYESREAWLAAVPDNYESRAEYAYVEQNDSLPNVLIIGDSISMQYTPGVQKRLAGVANVYRAPNNCRSTRQSVDEIEAYLGCMNWDVIHFNWGIHDITHLNEAGKVAPPPVGQLQVPPAEYRANFEKLITRLKKTGARLIWATTTPIGEQTESRGYRRDADVQAYNEMASAIVTDHAIATTDLYALVKPRAEELLKDGVHFTNEGAKVLADAVAESIQGHLEGGGTKTRPRFVQELLNTNPEQQERLDVAAAEGLLTLAPVNLPVNPKGDNNHFGWPVATMAGDTMIVVHRAMPGHNKKLAGSADEDTTYSVIVRSKDGGETWTEPYDVRECMTPEDRNRGGSVPLVHRYKFDPGNKSPLGYKLHLNAIGVLRDGAVLLVSDHGVFRSEDQGQSWQHLRMAFREDRHEGPFAFGGPRIIDDPEHGTLLFAHHTIFKNGSPNDIAREIAIYRSRDRGESWEKNQLALPEWCKPAEPDVITHEDGFVAIVRNQRPVDILAQMRFNFGDEAIGDVANTNMKTKVSVDTSALCFNPVTKRFEVVQSKREDMSINLYSIAPEDWDTAEWRFEGRLFKRGGKFYSTADGFHTGGAVMDEVRGVQHVFFYCGAPGGPAGIFRLTRSLDTPRLSAVLQGE